MTPAAKDRLESIILSLFLNFINIGIVPSRVASPDIVVIMKDSFI